MAKMTKKYKKHLERVVGVCTVIGLVVLGVYVHQHGKISSNDQAIQATHAKTARVIKKRKACTPASLQKNYDENEPNLGTALGDNQTNTKKGLKVAFNSASSLKTLHQAKPKIISLLGSDVGNKVFSTLNNQINSSNDKPTVGHKGDSIETCYVSYGKYDDMEGTAPVGIFVKYKTAPIKQQDNGAGGLRPVGKKQPPTTHKGYMTMSAMFNPKTKSMSLNTIHNQVN